MATEVAAAAAPPAEDVAVVKATDGKVTKEKKPRAPRAANGTKAPAAHPPYLQMVKEALVSLKERSGSSQYAIAKFLEGKYQLPPNFRKTLSVQLKNLVKGGKFVKVKNSFKLSDELKKPVKEVKKPIVKKVPKTGLKKVKTLTTNGSALKKAVKKVAADAKKKVVAKKADTTAVIKKRKAEAVPKAASKKAETKEKVSKKRRLSAGVSAVSTKKAAAPKKVGGVVKKAVAKAAALTPKKPAAAVGKKAASVKKATRSRATAGATSRGRK